MTEIPIAEDLKALYERYGGAWWNAPTGTDDIIRLIKRTSLVESQLAEALKEAVSVIEMLSTEHRVLVREGGGPENVFASLAASVAKALATEQAKVKVLREAVISTNRLVSGYKYVAWTDAGGLNECSHGVAESIHCRRCDSSAGQAALESTKEKP